MSQLGKLEKVDVRKIWEHEARDFSAWLVKPENLDLLGSEIGIQIEPLGTEADVGRFRIDILAQDISTGHKIVIENQLEPTNHDHLGKVITYAAGLDAKYLIWIVKDVLPEHVKAIDWLNEHLDDEISCFLIKIEVWQIGDSKPAPRFEVVSIKNDWAVTLKRSAESSEISPSRMSKFEFWQFLCEYIRQKDPQIKLRSPKPRSHFNFSIGSSEAHLALLISPQKNRFTCELYIRDEKQLLEFLKEREETLQASLGRDLEWFEASIASGLAIRLDVVDVFDPLKREQYAEWCFNKVLLFKKVLIPLITEYKSLNKI